MRKFFAITISAVFALLVLLAPSKGVQAFDPFKGIDCSSASSSALCSDRSKTGDPITGPNGIIKKVSLIIASIAGAAAVVMIIVGGFMYVTSAGDASKANDARRVIIYSVVGLIIIAMAQSIILFVLSRIT